MAPPCCPDRAGDRGKPGTPHWLVVHDADGALDIRATLFGGLPSSEAECAAVIRGMFAESGHWLVHASRTGRWLVWDGTVYEQKADTFPGTTVAWVAWAHREALRELREAMDEVVAVMPDGQRARMAEDARKARSRHQSLCDRMWSEAGQSAFIRQLARCCGEDDAALDCGTGEITVDNGRISVDQILRDGYVRLLPHDRRMLTTKRTVKGLRWDPGARCPAFCHLMETSVPDTAQRDWILWRTANSLFGRMPKKGFVNMIGERDSGKSTFAEIIAVLAGSYGVSVEVETFLAKHAGDQGFRAHRLMGARFVHSQEPRSGALYDEGFMKRLTGRVDRMVTRTLYEKAVEWDPQCTPFIGSNGPIRFNSSDDAFMSRQEVVRFKRGYERADPWLLDRMKQELDGILGLLLWYIVREAAEGMPPVPASMVEERERMADETESPLAFLSEALFETRISEKAGLPVSHYARVKDVYLRYQNWCDEAGEKPYGRKTFSAIVGRRYPVSKSGSHVFTGLVITG